jgi:hypothetical protein
MDEAKNSMNISTAVAFVMNQGNAVEQARLKYLLNNERPAPDVVTTLLAGQRADGGWSPFWAPDYGSLDATCYRLAQAEQMGITLTEPALTRALRFLAQRQNDDGSWEESARVAEVAPPWAKPGDLAARLYLTANCGWWLALTRNFAEAVNRAARHLESHLEDSGRLPSFLHAHWLGGGLWYQAARPEPAERFFRYLQTRLADLEAGGLAWLVVSLRLAGVPAAHLLLDEAATRLARDQKPDGRWTSEDGAERDVHATLEALRALRLCGQF